MSGKKQVCLDIMGKMVGNWPVLHISSSEINSFHHSSFQTWCKENFIHIRNMATVLSIRCQLSGLCERVGVACVSGGSECSQVLCRALLRGLFVNVAEHVGEGKYKTVSETLSAHIP